MVFINIDPVGPDTPEMLVETLQGMVGSVEFHIGAAPNFTAACNWLWRQPSDEYIFHLEDDWELVAPVHIDDLLQPFNREDSFLQVALRAYPYAYDKVCLSPSVLHRRFYKAVAGKLDERKNPEVQLRGNVFGLELPSPKEGIRSIGKVTVHSACREKIYIKDLGRAWLKKQPYARPDVKTEFTTWKHV